MNQKKPNSKASIKDWYLPIGFLFFVCLTVIFLYHKFDTPPKDYQRIVGSIQRVFQAHENQVRKIRVERNEEKKKKLAKDYLNLSHQWMSELKSSLDWLKENRAGHTMRLKSEMSTRAYQVRHHIQVIEETRQMLQNALKGITDPVHKELLDWNPKGAYDKLFPALKERRPKKKS